jgi:hypothetical protein
VAAATWRRRGPVDSTGPARLLVVEDDGPLVVECRRTPERGVKVGERFYPDELLRDVGCDTYMLAPAVEMPDDGDLRHPGGWEAVREVAQLHWVASWDSYDRARRRLNYDALWERGGGLGNLVKNGLWVLLAVVALYTGMMAYRAGNAASELRGEVAALRADVGRLDGSLYQVVRPAGPGPSPSVPPAATSVGAPAGDPRQTPRPAPTPTQRRP